MRYSRGRDPAGWEILTRKIAAFVYHGCQHLDVAGPLEVFSRTSRWLVDHRMASEPSYHVQITATEKGLVRTSSGLELQVDTALADLGSVDTFLVVGGIGSEAALLDRQLLDLLAKRARATRRFGSICSGALVLAAAELLRGREATTHWSSCSRLAELEPSCTVRSNALYVESDGIFSSAGVTAGIDLALSMVEDDFGKAVAVSVAQELVVYRRRAGGQDQFSRFLEAEKHEDRFGNLHLWILDNLGDCLSVERLAGQAGMSPRNFSRAFKQEVGMSPAQFVTRVRVEEACRQLEAGAESLKQVAAKCGFADEQNLRRVFYRLLGITPIEYRDRCSAR